MIYLDNSATTSPKPKSVRDAVSRAMNVFSANPGRGGHKPSLDTAEQIFECRKSLSDMFNLQHPENVVFTPNCTQALNYAIKCSQQKGNIVTSSIEHNAVMRPLHSLQKKGRKFSVAEVFFDSPSATLRSFERLIDSDTSLVICTHASNVCGITLPIAEIGALCHDRGVLFAVDAAQTAGVLPIDMQSMNIDYLCFPGHKGLYGPMGTGAILCRCDLPETIIEGGTGNLSNSFDQPDDLPERMESGTVNVPGIIGLRSGIDFVNSKGIDYIHRYETNLVRQLYFNLVSIKGIKFYISPPDYEHFAPILSFNISTLPSAEAASMLSDTGFAVRAGLHCAPAAHKRLGTIQDGTIRVSPSVFNNQNDINMFTKAVTSISKNIKK